MGVRCVCSLYVDIRGQNLQEGLSSSIIMPCLPVHKINNDTGRKQSAFSKARYRNVTFITPPPRSGAAGARVASSAAATLCPGRQAPRNPNDGSVLRFSDGSLEKTFCWVLGCEMETMILFNASVPVLWPLQQSISTWVAQIRRN